MLDSLSWRFKQRTLRKHPLLPNSFHCAHIEKIKCVPQATSLQSSACFPPQDQLWPKAQIHKFKNNSTIQKCPKTKSTTWSHKDFQPNHTMFKIPTNNNKMTMSHHQALNKTWNQQICQQIKMSSQGIHHLKPNPKFWSFTGKTLGSKVEKLLGYPPFKLR